MDFKALAQRVLELLAQRDLVQQMSVNPHLRTALGAFFVFPTRDQLTVLLGEAFFATLLSDEGRPTRFVLSLFPDEPAEEVASGQLDLERPLPVTREVIRQLAPTAPPARALLRLRLKNAGGEIASIMTFAGHFGRPPGLSIAGLSPGVLTVSFNNQKVLRISGDAVVALDGADLHFDADFAVRRLALHQKDGSDQGRLLVAELIVGDHQDPRKSGPAGLGDHARRDPRKSGAATAGDRGRRPSHSYFAARFAFESSASRRLKLLPSMAITSA